MPGKDIALNPPPQTPLLDKVRIPADLRRLREQDLEATEAKEAWIETRGRHAQVSADGEVLAIEGPLHYKSRPRALKVIVPQATPQAA